jgi:hypothetical protein
MKARIVIAPNSNPAHDIVWPYDLEDDATAALLEARPTGIIVPTRWGHVRVTDVQYNVAVLPGSSHLLELRGKCSLPDDQLRACGWAQRPPSHCFNAASAEPLYAHIEVAFIGARKRPFIGWGPTEEVAIAAAAKLAAEAVAAHDAAADDA